MQKIKDAALLYSSWGWHVLPIISGGKEPATAHGVKDASANPSQIRKWFKKDCNLAVAAGEQSGIVVLDIDPRNGGEESLERLISELGELPATQQQLTAGGGRHFIFKYEEGLRKCSVDQGIDFLSTGGYFLVAPSVVAGREYCWEIESDPHDGIEPARLPKSWIEYIQRSKGKKVESQLIKGDRHNGLVQLGGAMRNYGMTPAEILAALQVVNETRCEVPLPASEVRQIAMSMDYAFDADVAADAALGSDAAESILKDKKKKSGGFYFTVGNELLDQPAPISWVIKDWIPDNGVSMVYGESGGGKTFVTLDMACSIATGRQWLGRKTKPGTVLYLAGEGNFGIRQRLKAWCQENETDDLSNFHLSSRAIDLDVQQELITVVREAISAIGEDVSLIVVDTLNNHMSGDENTAKDTRLFINACNFLSFHFNCAVCLNHHVGHSSEAKNRARGSSAWKASLDSAIIVSKSGNETITIGNTKQKDAPLAEPLYVEIKQVEIDGWKDEDGNPVTSAVISQTDPPAPQEKSNKKMLERIKRFGDAWHHSGGDVVDDCPYLTRSALAEFLESNGITKSQGSTNQQLKPSNPSGLIGGLIDSNKIEEAQSGWVVTDEIWASQLLLAVKKQT